MQSTDKRRLSLIVAALLVLPLAFLLGWLVWSADRRAHHFSGRPFIAVDWGWERAFKRQRPFVFYCGHDSPWCLNVEFAFLREQRVCISVGSKDWWKGIREWLAPRGGRSHPAGISPRATPVSAPPPAGAEP